MTFRKEHPFIKVFETVLDGAARKYQNIYYPATYYFIMVEFDYLGEGEYTKRDENVKKLANELRSKNVPAFDALRDYIGKVYHTSKKFAKRPGENTASDVVSLGAAENCMDVGVAYCALARELGIPALFVYTVKENSLKNWLIDGNSNHIIAHPFVHILHEGEHKMYDPLHAFVDESNSFDILNDGTYTYVEVGRGVDPSAIHLRVPDGFHPSPINLSKKEDLIKVLGQLFEAEYKQSETKPSK
jgi:hypothetical protein